MTSDSRRELFVRHGKGRKSRTLPLGDEAHHWLLAYVTHERPQLVSRADEPFLFLSWRGHRLAGSNVGEVVHEAAQAAELKKRVTPHLLRHCCATHMLARGASIRHLQDFLGHATLSSTQVYTKVELTDLRRVLKRCHPREQRRTS